MDDVPADYIRIKASNAELQKRIAAFMERKKAESDVANVQEFCHRLPLSDESENSCARTEAYLISRKDSKSHLKTSRVVNLSGPQTQKEITQPKPTSTSSTLTPALQERLQNMEQHLGLQKNVPVPEDVYARIKALEERILYLESVSPEYFDGEFRFSRHKDDEEAMNKIDQRIAELRRNLKSS